MARGASAARRMQLNRSRIDQTMVAIGRGMLEVGRMVMIIGAVTAPDSPYMPYPLHEGLPNQGGCLVYYDGKKIYSVAGKGRGEPKPPRGAALGGGISRSRGLITIIGWGFPARFNEFGTAYMPAQPFFTAACDQVVPNSPTIMASAVKAELARQRLSTADGT